VTKATEKDRGHRTADDEAARTALRPVLLRYTIDRHGDGGPRPPHVPPGFGEEALVVFSFRGFRRGADARA
jgi:hypothetical protein